MPDEQPPHHNDDRDDYGPYSYYANSVQFEPTVWDMRLKCGQITARDNNWIVEPECEVTLPWAQVKLVLFFLGPQSV